MQHVEKPLIFTVFLSLAINLAIGTGSARDLSTSSLASRAQELQEQRKRGRAGASTARSSTARQTQAFVTTSWQDLAIAPGHSHARYARALGRLEVGVSSRVSKTSQELPMPSKALPRASKKLPRASERLQESFKSLKPLCCKMLNIPAFLRCF